MEMVLKIAGNVCRDSGSDVGGAIGTNGKPRLLQKNRCIPYCEIELVANRIDFGFLGLQMSIIDSDTTRRHVLAFSSDLTRTYIGRA